jgi:PPIC-type PPIASE domain
MRFPSLAGFLLAGLVCHQVGQAATPSAAAEKAPGAEVGADDPVITLDGFCADSTRQGGACSTAITRAQFDRLVEALQPGMSLPLRLKVANAYARNLRMSAAAQERGLDKTPAFAEELRFARLQLLSQDLDSALRADANRVTDADVRQYYEKNRASYERATVARVFVPHANQTGGATDTMTQVAADLRARARTGENPDTLQIEAYAQAGVTRLTADTKIENVRRTSLPPSHEAVLDLMPGQVSEVFSDPAGAHFIYKMLAKQTMSLDDVKGEIREAIAGQRYRDSAQSFQGGAVFNDAYFNPPGAPLALPLRNRRERRPSSSRDENQN